MQLDLMSHLHISWDFCFPDHEINYPKSSDTQSYRSLQPLITKLHAKSNLHRSFKLINRVMDAIKNPGPHAHWVSILLVLWCWASSLACTGACYSQWQSRFNGLEDRCVITTDGYFSLLANTRPHFIHSMGILFSVCAAEASLWGLGPIIRIQVPYFIGKDTEPDPESWSESSYVTYSKTSSEP